MNRLISASAGSGKTYALTTQYLRLLRARHQDVISGKETTLRVDSLMAATFTRKAAGEIFDRILSRLADAALTEEGLARLRDALDEPSLTSESCQDLLLQLCQNLHRVQVGTLDSFFQRLCRVYRQEAGLSGEMRMTSPDSPRCLALQKEALQAMLGEMDDPKKADALFQTLTKQKAPSSVVPKLLTLLQGISESVGDAEPGHWEKLHVPARPEQKDIDTALVTLEDYLLTLNGLQWPNAVRGDLERYRAREWEKFIDGGLAKPCLAQTFTYYNVPIPAKQVSAYEVLLATAQHELLAALEARTLAIRDLYTKYSEKFIEGRKAEGLVLFSETPALLTKILGDAAETARRLNSPLEHVLLDEFQDTSDPQWGLLRGFAVQAACAPGSVLVVGDAKQAIYGWRGGRAEIFEQIENDIEFLARETLAKSYRSSQVVLDVVNDVFKGIKDNGVFQPSLARDAATLADNEKKARHQQTAELWAAYFNPHEAAGEKHGFFEMCVSPVPPDPQVAAPADDDGEEEEAEDDGKDWNAAGASYHLVQCAARIAGEIGRMPPGMSAGVLVRTNKTLAQMTDLLWALGVAVSSEGVGKIVDDPAVELLLSGLLLADHPGHSAAAWHVTSSPLAEALGLTRGEILSPEKATGVAASIRRQVLIEGYAGLLARWASLVAPFGMDRTARRLEQVLEMAAGFDALPPMRSSEFVRAVRESTAENPGTAPVRVLTINRAKGLEFDAVFLPDLEWKTRASDKTCLVKRASVKAISGGASPIEAVYARPNATLQRLDPELLALSQIEEADEVTGMLCLLYVAMTRAKHALHLYVAPHKIKQNGTPQQPGLKPAAILRAAFCGSAAHPNQGTEWTSLSKWGQADWYGAEGEVIGGAPTAALLPARPTLRFRASEGGRRGSPAQAPTHGGTMERAVDLLRLK